MIQRCERCRRANPREAVYCHFDGAILTRAGAGDVPADGSAMNVGVRPFPTPFLMPSGEACKNFVDLCRALHADSAVAHDLLRQGAFEAFFARLGRADLCVAATAAARAPDPVRGLDEILGRLPGCPLTAARLRVGSSEHDLGVLAPGEDREFTITLANEGMRLLFGVANPSGVDWLALDDRGRRQSRLFQFSGQTTFTVRIIGRHLRAYARQQEAEIRLTSNGGSAVVVVRVLVPVRPFAEGALAGADSPRQLAEKARQAPGKQPR